MNFEEYTIEEFKKGEKRMDKIEVKIDLMDDKLDEIKIALKVDEKLRAVKARNTALFYGGIMSIVVGVVSHLIKGML